MGSTYTASPAGPLASPLGETSRTGGSPSLFLCVLPCSSRVGAFIGLFLILKKKKEIYMSTSATVMSHGPPQRQEPRRNNRNHMWRGQFPRHRVPEKKATCAPQCPDECPWRTEENTCRIYRGHVSTSLKLYNQVVWRDRCRMLELEQMEKSKGNYDYGLLEARLGIRSGIHV
jgi:hypothetical protein